MDFRLMAENKPKPEQFSVYLPSFEALRTIMDPCGLVPMTMGYDIKPSQPSYIPPPGKRHVGTIKYYVNCQVIEDDVEGTKHDWAVDFQRQGAYSVFFTSRCRRCGCRVESEIEEDAYGLPNGTNTRRYFLSSSSGDIEVEDLPPCHTPR